MTALRSIVDRLGGEIASNGQEAFVPGPGHSPRDRGLHLSLMAGGRIVWNSFHGDNADARAVFDYLGIAGATERRVSKAEWAAAQQRRAADRRRAEAVDLAYCQSIWNRTQPIEGTPAESYLWSRGLMFEGLPELRFHPAAPRAKPRQPDDNRPMPPPHPAMVALVRAADGRPRAVHVTYLTPAGKKAFGDRSRLMFGPTAGAAVRLAPPTPAGVLAVAEGIETAGSFSVLKGLPCWATLSTSGLMNFVVPAGVTRLLVAADNDDDKGNGRKAASELAQRARKQCNVEIHPAPHGQDWNDVLQGGEP